MCICKQMLVYTDFYKYICICTYISVYTLMHMLIYICTCYVWLYIRIGYFRENISIFFGGVCNSRNLLSHSSFLKFFIGVQLLYSVVFCIILNIIIVFSMENRSIKI